ncbi:hypothetical protein LEP1GSC060_2658 [Leptospira weilii serovar Ranarum str. ICFT]|uniref:Uncharacterized protein n=1 Tax=Leptospira weilii serovar Ranarum str. ICFT TaxID=1218598 RepID=N1WG39_9LEPT|nr:hypothetical protein [Leptospira weilii]EMY77905.1 hypothetical protein LEP1GSC060_2658 [Leptospira weilii serovar Ranarum str. ICFT]
MFFLLLESIYFDFASGRTDWETYCESVILLAQDQEKLAGFVSYR